MLSFQQTAQKKKKQHNDINMHELEQGSDWQEWYADKDILACMLRACIKREKEFFAE